jgi:hypothetical protein
MNEHKKDDIDSKILFILKKIQDEYEIIKRQGFPSHTENSYLIHPRTHDTKISENRWRSWANELNIDYTQLESLLKIIENEGLLEKSKFIPDYI